MQRESVRPKGDRAHRMTSIRTAIEQSSPTPWFRHRGPVVSWLLRPARYVVAWSLWKGSDKFTRGAVRIGVIDIAADPENIISRVCAALDLIQERDPVFYARLEQYILRIAILPRGRTSYWPEFRTCVLITTNVKTWHVTQLASIIVHEATHAWIRERGIRPGKNGYTRDRVEQTCLKAQLRLARRLEHNEEMVEHLIAQYRELSGPV
jgi:hypothetical protein